MRAELRYIEPNNDNLSWDDFVATGVPEPWDFSGQFTLSIGSVGSRGADLFVVVIATHAGACRLKGHGTPFKGLIVESFEPEIIAKFLHEYVSSIESPTWQGIVEQLKPNMDWEFSYMEPIQ